MNFVDQLHLGLQVWSLGGNQPENGNLVSWNLLQGLKGSRTRVVVFEQKPLGADSAEDLLGEIIVTSLQQPPATLVTPSKMEAEGDLWVIAYHGVVHFDTGL